MAHAQYVRTVAITEGLETGWQTYQRQHPGVTFSGTMRALLSQFLTEAKEAPCVSTTTT
jgi:hypothetical protein